MNFAEFFRFIESDGADWGYFGELTPILGNGKSETLNYGSGKGFSGPPMIYVPIKREESRLGGILSSFRRQISKQGIECRPDSSAFNGYACKASENPHQTDLMHTGESHITVALGSALAHVFEDKENVASKIETLKKIKLPNGNPLFDAQGNGISMPVNIGPRPFVIYGVAKYFSGKPLVALLSVSCPNISEVRQALNLPPLPPNYKTHITIGYAYGVDLGDIITTDRKKGKPISSTSIQHDRTYKQQYGIKESILRTYGIFEYIVEPLLG